MICFLLQYLLIISPAIPSSFGHNHVVGDSIWSIPPSTDFYLIWSRNRSFTAGDSLVFRFDTGLSNVVQVSRREYESCSAQNPFRSFEVGPAIVSLMEEGVYYFTCTFGNYCFLGQKLSVAVAGNSPAA
ncbi:Umecyanin [Apostasia shenzhenica]|uniref:Umecyanin n=1 Tax=Apostasia shenzhenica TaxID=1088818 RepID=A0A2H9ZSC1_9ASPA|nr:Umecyanin [Apostasia shenzhenica]